MGDSRVCEECVKAQVVEFQVVEGGERCFQFIYEDDIRRAVGSQVVKSSTCRGVGQTPTVPIHDLNHGMEWGVTDHQSSW